ncbi:MAG TPA: TetR/AcrR family transcriptional regulator [Nocardioides sp.]|uniref:TetR/AcrR family transcriptional regulator n=1 Tax=Nocardioides sp. TaxID=35761 RepID=UPI002C981C33|nr:TetR/AcrR family transcriptional regulator [Nocardioides sp.]HQR28341.1 TetR/AcrR family transcriptional regulator [Nocardioides sp.]
MATTEASQGQSDTRRDQMLTAAAELIAERGLARTRIADVAARVGTSPALVVYYFATKDGLLIEALRHSEAGFYRAVEDLLQRPATLEERLATLVDLTISVGSQGEVQGHWGLWFELWCEAFRHPEVARDRRQLDEQWRAIIRRVVLAAVEDGEVAAVDVDRFALTWAALLDGLAVQVALEDEVVTEQVAQEVALTFARRELGLR